MDARAVGLLAVRGLSGRYLVCHVQNADDVRLIGQATSASQFFRQTGATVGAALMGAVRLRSKVMNPWSDARDRSSFRDTNRPPGSTLLT